jgi:hypothetical protein
MSKPRHTNRFPRQDEIRFVEYELRSADKDKSWRSALVDRPQDLTIWLARTRDKKSWREIGAEFFGTFKPEARRTYARRAYDRVEQILNEEDGPAARARYLNDRIEELFGVSAEDFRAYLSTGKLPRRQRKMSAVK